MSAPATRALLPCFLAMSACAGADDGPTLTDDGPVVVARYAAQVDVAYGAAVDGARDLEAAIDAFLVGPDATTHAAAKQAWLAARVPYELTEAFRFYDGPIDDAVDGPEGRINAWPMDEAYIDYVDGMPAAGVINDTTVTIDAATLIGLNEVGGETNIATGWHAIEFLLWGQDHADDGPGDRSHEDFVDGGPMANPDRRREYLRVVTALLVSDLESVAVQWDAGQGYAAEFVALPVEASLAKILRGLGALSGAELSGERINVAYDTKAQEDEHSCFSDNTNVDLTNDFLGIEQVYFADLSGRGASIDDLVEARNPELADRLRRRFEALHADFDAWVLPFDQAIQGDDSAPGRVALARTVVDLRALADEIVEVADLFGIALDVEI